MLLSALSVEVEALDDLVDPRVVVAQAEVAGLDAQRLAHAEEGIEHQLLRHHSESAARTTVVAHHVVAHHREAAAVRARQPRQQADQRRLARAVRPQQTEELAGFDVQVDPVEGAHRSVALGGLPDFDCGHRGSARSQDGVPRLARPGRRFATVGRLNVRLHRRRGTRSLTPYSAARLFRLALRLRKIGRWPLRRPPARTHSSSRLTAEESTSVTRLKSTWTCGPSNRRSPSASTVWTVAIGHRPFERNRSPSRTITAS